MLDFCGEHAITADVEVVPIQQIDEAYDPLLKAEVHYRFSIDLASLQSESMPGARTIATPGRPSVG